MDETWITSSSAERKHRRTTRIHHKIIGVIVGKPTKTHETILLFVMIFFLFRPSKTNCL